MLRFPECCRRRQIGGPDCVNDENTKRPMHAHTRLLSLAVLPVVAALALGACATTGATYNSGVGDRFLDRPPYRAGKAVSSSARFIRLPLTYQQGATHSPIFDPSGKPGSPMAALLAEMNAYADSLLGGHPGSSGSVAAMPRGTPPDVHFGCELDAIGDCADPDESGPAVRSSVTTQPRMRLAVGRPSGEWIEATAAELERSRAEVALVLTLEVGHYWVTKTGWANRKSLELGTNHSVRLPWLTSLETPVSVLQLTGVAVGREGRAMLIGAEGMHARRTEILASGFGMQALITDEDVERLRTMRREDLPGQPLVWQVAMRELVADLTGRSELAARQGI